VRTRRCSRRHRVPAWIRLSRRFGSHLPAVGGNGVKLVAYLRVSTIEQADKGYGLDIQREAIAKAA